MDALTISSGKYGALLAKALPKVIANDRERKHFSAMPEPLDRLGRELTPEEKTLDVLARLIADYDDKDRFAGTARARNDNVPDRQKDLKQADLPPVFGSRSVASDVLNGKREPSKAHIRKLADFFDLSPATFFRQAKMLPLRIYRPGRRRPQTPRHRPRHRSHIGCLTVLGDSGEIHRSFAIAARKRCSTPKIVKRPKPWFWKIHWSYPVQSKRRIRRRESTGPEAARLSAQKSVERTDSCASYEQTERRTPMQFALLIYQTPEEFDMRNEDYNDPHLGAWRAYHKALVEAGVYVGGNALEVPETGTTVRLREGKRGVQDGPYADTKEQLAGFIVLDLPSVDAALEWAARCPGATRGAVEVRPLAPEAMRRGFIG